MLYQRVITALILIPLVVLGVFKLSSFYFSLLLAGVVLLAAQEWLGLAALRRSLEKLVFFAGLIVGMVVLHYLLPLKWFPEVFFAFVSLFWLLITLYIIAYTPDRALRPGKPVKSLIGWLVLLPTWAALTLLHTTGGQGPALVLFCMSLSWVADTGAYFSGRYWGRVKLSPHISPKKTREGVYGALVLVVLWSAILLWLLPGFAPLWAIALLGALVCVVSVVGDLFESLLKRQAGIKDSGKLLPGHGGILDRIDSLTAVAPVFAAGLLLLDGVWS